MPMSQEMGDDAKDGDSGLLILILLIVLLLGGIGMGGYWFVGHRRQAAVQAEMQAREAAQAAQEAAAAHQKAKAP